jgi:hypothetical protein
VNLASTSYVHSGTVAVSYTITGAYGAFAPQLSSGSFDTAPFTNIRFWVNGEAAGGQQLALTVKFASTNTWGKVIKIDPYITGGSVGAGQWRLVDLPLSVLGASNTTINRIALQGSIATAQPSVSVDDIDFLRKPVPPKALIERIREAIAMDEQSRESATGMAQYRGICCIRIDFDGFNTHHLLHTPVESSRGSFLQKLAKLVFG